MMQDVNINNDPSYEQWLADRKARRDTPPKHARMAIQLLDHSLAWKRMATDSGNSANGANSSEVATCYADQKREQARVAAEYFGRSMGRLFRALERAYDMGLAHARR